MTTEERAALCECGEPRPCVYHDVTDNMREATAILRRLAPAQRGRVLVWFCNACRGAIVPGTPHRCAEGETDARERAEDIRAAVAEERERHLATIDRLRAERNADYNATELGRIADELDEENRATDAAHVRAAAATMARRVDEEREACASIADALGNDVPGDVGPEACARIAAAIRARGTP